MVGHIARRENERRFLAMQLRQLGLELHQRAIRTRDVARPTRTCTHPARGRAHRFDHFWVLAHAEIVVGAPEHDIVLAVRTIPESMGELSHFALQVDEDAIAPLALQSGNGRLKTPVVVEHWWKSFMTGSSARRTRQSGRGQRLMPSSTRVLIKTLCDRGAAGGGDFSKLGEVYPRQAEPRITLQKLPRVKCGSLSASTSAFTLP